MTANTAIDTNVAYPTPVDGSPIVVAIHERMNDIISLGKEGYKKFENLLAGWDYFNIKLENDQNRIDVLRSLVTKAIEKVKFG